MIRKEISRVEKRREETLVQIEKECNKLGSVGIRAEVEEEAKERLFQRYGLEGDVLDKLEEIKDNCDAGYAEMSYFLILLNMILRDFSEEEFILVVSKYLAKTKKGVQYYVLDKETISNLIGFKGDIEIENKIIDAEQNINKTVARIEIEERLRTVKEKIEKYLEKNGDFLADIYSGNGVKIGDYFWDEERNFCYKDGKFYLNQWDELGELNYSEL